MPGFLLVETLDGQGPAAQSRVTSLGRSQAYAGFAYSDAAWSNAGAAGVDKSSVPVIAGTSYPDRPKSQTSTPVGSVQSRSEATSSSAEARVGPDGRNISASTAAACGPDGSVVATGATTSEVLNFGSGTLTIASLRSSALAQVDGAGHRKLVANLDVEGVSVAGMRAAITEKGIVAAGAGTTLPDNPLASTLKAAGIRVAYVASAKDADGAGITAPALEVTVERQVPGVGTGSSSVTYTFGRAYARASSLVDAEAPTPVVTSASPPGATSGDVASASATLPATLPLAPVPPPPAAALATPTLAPLDVVAVPGAQANALSLAPVPAVALGGFYAMLAIGAVLLLAAALVFRRVGVKLA